MAELILRNITKFYGDHKVIDRLNLQINSGEFVTLLGPSGCGKTTLLRMIAGLETIDNGELFIGGRKSNTVPAQKRGIAMVFQSYALFPHMNVKNNIVFGLRIKGMPEHDMFSRLDWVLPLLGLEGLEHRLPREISGGQRQRVALARALVLDPDVLLLDEPLSNLDTALREMAMEELKRIHRQVGKTIIYVTHNQAEAMSMSERIAVMNAGGLEQYDTPRILYNHPRTIFSSEFIGSPAANLIKGVVEIENGNLFVESEVGRIVLDDDRASAASGFAGRPVLVGIRPQDVMLGTGTLGRRSSDSIIPLRVELIENLGDRSLVVGRTDADQVLRFMSQHDDDLFPDSRVGAVIDGRRIHLFDPDSRLNIFAV